MSYMQTKPRTDQYNGQHKHVTPLYIVIDYHRYEVLNYRITSETMIPRNEDWKEGYAQSIITISAKSNQIPQLRRDELIAELTDSHSPQKRFIIAGRVWTILDDYSPSESIGPFQTETVRVKQNNNRIIVKAKHIREFTP